MEALMAWFIEEPSRDKYLRSVFSWIYELLQHIVFAYMKFMRFLCLIISKKLFHLVNTAFINIDVRLPILQAVQKYVRHQMILNYCG